MDAKYMNRQSGSDTLPYEVVNVVNAKKVLVRPMAATMATDWTPDMRPGGFSAHCANNDSQRWDIAPIADAPTETVTLRKDGKWRLQGCNWVEFTPSATPIKFYDFNY